LSVELTDRWYGKDQFHAIPSGKMVDPTIPKLMAAIEGSVNGGSVRKPRRTLRKGQ